MASFFEKLKKGMGIEEQLGEDVEETVEEKPAEALKKAPRRKRISVSQRETVKKPKKLEIRRPQAEEEEELTISEKPIETEEEAKRTEPSSSSSIKEEMLLEKVGEKTKEVWEKEKEEKEKWPNFGGEAEGQLAIDVYQTESDLVVQSAIAGVRPENLDIVLEKDILTIKGTREKPFDEEGDFFSQECYWGPFSREIILPAEVDPNQATAKMKEGVLTIRIPKILREKKRKVIVTG